MYGFIKKKTRIIRRRVLRLIVGLILCVPFFTHGYPFSYFLLGIGGILIFNGISGICMIYKIFGYSSCKIES